ncbi:hypothetical protein GY21_11955 [Cryobacterium roopkundense]|uniref:Uncharacterized protein n=1 Tax=Cryobacterium roopkundense TaxID=1001240 RepID=A0A099J656_9MICO|nr:hypothetical protein [Cryobacterium roopkundense]KGJ72933.1 hypothetical protein GY21_11955 [Cryobacterium roopkundense]MBB5641065.1 hypothetical protein [Cryobacterium roopkundense]
MTRPKSGGTILAGVRDKIVLARQGDHRQRVIERYERSQSTHANTIVRWSDVGNRGGHFAALEEPQLLIDDLRSEVLMVPGWRVTGI